MSARAFTVPTEFTAANKFSAPVRSMAEDMNKFSQKAQSAIGRADQYFKKLTPAISETAKQFFAFATTAAIAGSIIAAIHFSVQSVKDYDKALGSLRAVTGLTGAAFVPFEKKIIEVAQQTKSSSVDVAKAFELIGSANSALLEDADAMGKVTKAAIILSQASGDDLASSASSLIGVMNQFNLAADQSERTMNVLAAGAKVGAASIPDVAEAMKNFGSVAAGANISVEQSVALVEVLSQKSIFGAEAGTKLRGSILKLQQAGLGYASGQFEINDALAEAKKKIDAAKTAKEQDAIILKMFGAENIATGKILLSNTKMFKDFTAGVTGTSEATTQAAEQNATLAVRLDQLSNKWVTLITGADGSKKALSGVGRVVVFITDNMEALITVGLSAIGFLVAFKIAIWASKAALLLYNIAIGITAALQGTSAMAMKGNIIALGAYKISMGIATAGQWLWNVALGAGAIAMQVLLSPITLIILAIAALVIAVILIIKYWQQWGAAVTAFLAIFVPGFAFMISLVQSFRRNWDFITKSFSEGGILEGIKAIGATLFDAVLMPLQQILEIIAKVTGADWAGKAAESVNKFRQDMGVNVTTDESGNPLKEDQPVNSELSKQESLRRTIETQRQNVAIDINDNTGRAKVNSDNNLVPIKLSSTMGGVDR